MVSRSSVEFHQIIRLPGLVEVGLARAVEPNDPEKAFALVGSGKVGWRRALRRLRVKVQVERSCFPERFRVSFRSLAMTLEGDN